MYIVKSLIRILVSCDCLRWQLTQEADLVSAQVMVAFGLSTTQATKQGIQGAEKRGRQAAEEIDSRAEEYTTSAVAGEETADIFEIGEMPDEHALNFTTQQS